MTVLQEVLDGLPEGHHDRAGIHRAIEVLRVEGGDRVMAEERIHDVKQVFETDKRQYVNALLADNWTLLSVGTDPYGIHHYSLGHANPNANAEGLIAERFRDQ